jgi:hypothetical protein
MAESIPVTLPRSLKKVQVSDPGFSSERDADIRDSENSYVNQSIKTLRQISPIKAIRALSRFNGTVSTALFSYVQVAMTDYKVMAYQTGTNQFSPEGAQAARNILAMMDTAYDYTQGYNDRLPLQALIETQLKETAMVGMLAGELVLNKFQLPERVSLVPAESIQWRSKGNGTKYPLQRGQEGDIPLDIPNFWVCWSNQSANTFFPRSMFEAALNTTFVYAEFIEDMVRVIRQSGHSRLVVLLNQEKVINSAPVAVRNDPAKLSEHLASEKSLVEKSLQGLNPDDALVLYDTAEFETLKTAGEKADYTTILQALSGLMATSLKSMPSVLGLRLQGSQSLSNTETLIFLKMARAIQLPVEQFWSKALTLAVRLTGADVYVRFLFAPIELRPEGELEAYRQMRQARILELLSLGFYTDEEAAEYLGTGPRAPGAPKLSGTMFHQQKAQAMPSANNGAQEKTLAPKTPNSAGGEDNDPKP